VCETNGDVDKVLAHPPLGDNAVHIEPDTHLGRKASNPFARALSCARVTARRHCKIVGLDSLKTIHVANFEE
jgi:hypothetical protein